MRSLSHKIKLIKYIVVAVITMFMLSACENSTPESDSSANGGKKLAVAKKKPKPPGTKKKEVIIIPEYRYSRSGKKNPFTPLVAVKKKSTRKNQTVAPTVPIEELTPLQKVETNSLKLLGIIVGKGAPRAMVDAPDRKSYILKIGTKVGKNNGVVVDIAADAVYVKERYQDFSGEVHENIVKVGLPDREGDF